MRERTVHLTQCIPFLVSISALAAVVSVCLCSKDVYSLFLNGRFYDIITAFVKANILTVVVFLFALLFLYKTKNADYSKVILILPILWGIFFFFRFASNILVRNYSLILLQSFITIAYFFVCAYCLTALKRVIFCFGTAETNFALFWSVSIFFILILSVIKTHNIDLCVSTVELGALPLLIILRHRINSQKHTKQENKSNDGNMKNYYTVILFLNCVFFALYYFNREATDLEGIDAYCALLMSQGKMIYRDFFFYVPPLYIFHQYLVWLLFDGAILPLRLFGIAERALLICIIFRLLCRWFKQSHAYIACLLTFFFYNSNVFNSYGDYTQLCQILLILAACFASFFVDCLHRGKERPAFGWLFFASMLATQSLMCKQSIGAIAMVCLFGVLILFCLVTGEGKRTFRWIGCILLGFFISILPYLIWFLLNDSLYSFLNQVFFSSLNSKGLVVSGTSTQTSTYVRIINRIFNADSFVLWVCTLSAILFHFVQKNHTKWKFVWRFLSLLASLFTILKMLQRLHSVAFFSSVVYLAAALIQNLSKPQILLFSIAILFFLACFVAERFTKKRVGGIFAVILAAFIFLSWFVTTLYPISTLNEILATYDASLIWPVFYEFAFHFCAIFFVADLARYIVEKKSFVSLECWFFIAIAMANALVSLMGGGTASFACNGALFTMPFAVCVWLVIFSTENRNAEFVAHGNIAANTKWNKAKKIASAGSVIFLVVLICTVSLISMGQHIKCVYSFYGWFAEPIMDENAYIIDLSRYEGMRVSKKTKVTLEQVTKLVEENSEEGDFVWSFPATKIYNILTDHLEQPTFTPTYFFDTCPDSIAYSDLEILKENPPDIIIWKEMGENCWEFYEKNYRNGAELGQREIQRWFESVKDSEYILIGNAYNEFVYMRNDGTIPAYTYYSDGSDFIGNAEDVANNLPKSRIGNAVYDFVASTGVLSVNRTMALVIVVLFGTPALLLLEHQKPWKAFCAVLLVIALTLEMSWVFYLVFAFILVYVLFCEKKTRIIWLELALLSLIVLTAILQWSWYWPIILKYIALLSTISLHFVFSMDAILALTSYNRGPNYETT